MTRKSVLALLLLGMAVSPGWSWWPKGHSIVAEAAVRSLPGQVPAFFRQGAAQIAHCAQDPDVAKNRDLPIVSAAEGPEHYLDWELLRGNLAPRTREKYYQLLAGLSVSAADAGTLPYSVSEGTERLAVFFAEHRRWPQNPFIRTKCLIYAGTLAHYAGDLTMPLHTTIHHDGRARPDGSTPRSGIHMKVDSLIERLDLKPVELARGQIVAPMADIFDGVMAELKSSHALVDRVYELEAQLPPATGSYTPSAEIRSFTTERARAATRFLASLYLSAWVKSAAVTLPSWLEREPLTPSKPTASKPTASRPAPLRQ